MMRVWIASFFILFALSQFIEWLKATEFSLSTLVGAGLVLAIASNYDKRHSFPFWPAAKPQAASPMQTIVTVAEPSLDGSSLNGEVAQTVALPTETAPPKNP